MLRSIPAFTSRNRSPPAAIPLINCWSVLGTGLPNAPVTQLRIEGASPRYGRGLMVAAFGKYRSQARNPKLRSLKLHLQRSTFPDQPVQTTSPQKTVVVTNTGTEALEISQITVSADFTQTNYLLPVHSGAGLVQCLRDHHSIPHRRDVGNAFDFCECPGGPTRSPVKRKWSERRRHPAHCRQR